MESNYGELTKYVLEHVGGKLENIKDFRFWKILETYQPTIFGLSINTEKFKMMECRFSTDNEREFCLLGQPGHDYKCVVVPVDEKYADSSRTMYAIDLLSEFQDGWAFPKEDGDYLVENVKHRRQLGQTAYEEYASDYLYHKDGTLIWSNDFVEENN